MTTETVNGLHSCKPGNEPIEGQIRTFVVEQRTSKKGKPWIKIKSAGEDYGGQPFRIVSAQKTDFTDEHGNLSFNLEIEAVNGKKLSGDDPPFSPGSAPQSPPARQDKDGLPCVASAEQGVTETRKHLMQSANLLVLCIRAAEKAVAPHQPEVAQTSEQFQSDVAKLFIEASSRRTNDGVHWWSYIDKMPTTPLT